MKLIGYGFRLGGVGFLLATPLWMLAADGANPKGAEVETVSCNLTQEKSHSTGLSIQAELNKSTYRLGDRLTLNVTPSVDAHIMVIDQGSNPDNAERGKVLFPDTFVKGEDAYMFPSPGSTPLEITGHAGINTLEIVARRYPEKQAESGKPEKPKDVNFASEPAPSSDEIEIARCTVRFAITDKPAP